MTGYYLYIMINMKLSFQAYKKVTLSNSSNSRDKVVKKFVFLYCLMIKRAKRKLETQKLSKNTQQPLGFPIKCFNH